MALGSQTHFSHAVLAVVVVSAIACGSKKPQASTPQSESHRTIVQGYSLLYAMTSQQKDLKKLLLVKRESDPVDDVISELADYAGDLSAELEDMARRYPALSLETQFLPEVEVKARESIGEETKDALLEAKGKRFERRLLLKQASALEHEQHIAKVMVALETTEDRRAFWVRTEKGLREHRRQVEQLLERSYFSK